MDNTKPFNNKILIVSTLILLFYIFLIEVNQNNNSYQNIKQEELVNRNETSNNQQEGIQVEMETYKETEKTEIDEKEVKTNWEMKPQKKEIIEMDQTEVISINWEKEPITTESKNVYKLGVVSDGMYEGLDFLLISSENDFPSSHMRVIRDKNKDKDIILVNYSNGFMDGNLLNSYVKKNNIFINNFYLFEELKLNFNTSLVIEKDNYQLLLLKDNKDLLKTINFGIYTLYKKDGSFFALNNDGTLQKYNLKLNFTDCVSDEQIKFCKMNIKLQNGEIINGNHNMSVINKTCGFRPLHGYNYNDSILINNLKEIGKTDKGDILYEPKNIQKYLLDVYNIDSYEGYDHPIIFWQDPFGDFIEIINMDFYNSKYAWC